MSRKRTTEQLDTPIAAPLNTRPRFDQPRTASFQALLDDNIYTGRFSRIAALPRDIGDMIRQFELNPCRLWAIHEAAAYHPAYTGVSTRYFDLSYDDAVMSKPAHSAWRLGPELVPPSKMYDEDSCFDLADVVGGLPFGSMFCRDTQNATAFIFHPPDTQQLQQSARPVPWQQRLVATAPIHDWNSNSTGVYAEQHLFVFGVDAHTAQPQTYAACLRLRADSIDADAATSEWRAIDTSTVDSDLDECGADALNGSDIYIVGKHVSRSMLPSRTRDYVLRYDSVADRFHTLTVTPTLDYGRAHCIAMGNALWCTSIVQGHWDVVDPRSPSSTHRSAIEPLTLPSRSGRAHRCTCSLINTRELDACCTHALRLNDYTILSGAARGGGDDACACFRQIDIRADRCRPLAMIPNLSAPGDDCADCMIVRGTLA